MMRNVLSWPKIEKSLIAISFLIAGYLVGRGIQFQYFYLSQEIDLLDLVSILITVWAAFYVGKVLARKNEGLRVEKDLILAQIDNIESYVKDGAVEILTGTIQLAKVSSTLKHSRTSVSQIARNLDLANMAHNSELDLLDGLLKKLRDLCTDTPSQPLPNVPPPINVIDNIVHYSQDRILEIEKSFQEFYDKMFDLKIKVNRC